MERSEPSLAAPTDATQADEPVTLAIVDGLLVLVIADGGRRILARLDDLEPYLEGAP